MTYREDRPDTSLKGVAMRVKTLEDNHTALKSSVDEVLDLTKSIKKWVKFFLPAIMGAMAASGLTLASPLLKALTEVYGALN